MNNSSGSVGLTLLRNAMKLFSTPNLLSRLSLAALLLLGVAGCDDSLSEKTDLDFIDVPTYDSSSVAYVPILPAIEGLSQPVDVLVGYDELIYVVDAATEEIIQYDQANNRLSAMTIPGVRAVAQDRQLNLLALGTFDTVINDINYALPTIYRINPIGENTVLSLNNAEIANRIVHPFYFKIGFSNSDANVSLNDLDVLADGSYYVTRSGPSNSPTKFGGPDNAVLRFSASDQWETFLPITTEQGVVNNYFDEPGAITTFAKPPQGPFVDKTEDFIVAVRGIGTAIKVQYILATTSSTGDEQFRLNSDLVLGDTSQAEGFLYEANRFVEPSGVTVTGDGSNLLFVTDTELDSLYVFTWQGLEGVNPPPGSDATKNINVSFGGEGDNPTEFQDPVAVAYTNELVYVCDRNNGRILRFRLTTDFQ